jgi:hypothetical protein
MWDIDIIRGLIVLPPTQITFQDVVSVPEKTTLTKMYKHPPKNTPHSLSPIAARFYVLCCVLVLIPGVFMSTEMVEDCGKVNVDRVCIIACWELFGNICIEFISSIDSHRPIPHFPHPRPLQAPLLVRCQL